MRVEVLSYPPGVRYSNKATQFLSELEKHKPSGVRFVDRITGKADWLMVYGPSGPPARQAIKRYEHWVALDLGYWDRCRSDYPMRASIEATHPADHLGDYGAHRWDARGVELTDDYDPAGHVLVAGVGRKAARNSELNEWDQRAVTRARAKFGRRVKYRPKPVNRHINMAHPIQNDLAGAAYVITHHSNVGVEAIIQGIPVSTEEGAARYLYDKSFSNKPASYDARLDFLRRLAWWNWKRSEVPQFWQFIRERMHERIR